MQKILSADVVFSSGLMLEGRLQDTLSKVGQKRPVFAIMMTLALILLLYYAIPKLASFKFPRFEISIIKDVFSFRPLALMILLAAMLAIQRTLSDDDLTYLAFLNNWQHSSALNFNDVFFGADKLASVRFWIVSTPFSQAFLAEISKLPGIFILGGYYEPFLAALSLFSIYELAKTLGLSRFKAMAAVGFQVVFLALLSEYLHPGAPFFRQLSVDKATATFIVIPVFLQSIVWYLDKPIRKNLLLVLLTGLSLMLMHPVALVYGIIIAGLITVFGLNPSNLRARIVLLIMLALIMSLRASRSNMPLGLVGLCITPTMTLPNSATDCSMTSMWPRCSGSKLPG